MSEYGSDKNPDLNIATDVTLTEGLMPFKKTNVMQWTYEHGVMVQKYASKQGKSNLLTKQLVPPIGAGDLCGNCWGPGKPFGDVVTPDRIEVSISGLGKSVDWIPSLGEPISGKFLLNQNPAQTCFFRYDVDDYSIDIVFSAGLVGSIVTFQATTMQWLIGTFEVCATTLTGGAQFGFENGLIRVTIPAI